MLTVQLQTCILGLGLTGHLIDISESLFMNG